MLYMHPLGVADDARMQLWNVETQMSVIIHENPEVLISNSIYF